MTASYLTYSTERKPPSWHSQQRSARLIHSSVAQFGPDTPFEKLNKANQATIFPAGKRETCSNPITRDPLCSVSPDALYNNVIFDQVRGSFCRAVLAQTHTPPPSWMTQTHTAEPTCCPRCTCHRVMNRQRKHNHPSSLCLLLSFLPAFTFIFSYYRRRLSVLIQGGRILHSVATSFDQWFRRRPRCRLAASVAAAKRLN